MRIYHLNKSATYKIVQDTSVILAASRGGEFTAYLALRLTARAAVILWTSFAVMPAEIVFDAIEAELERRGVAL